MAFIPEPVCLHWIGDYVSQDFSISNFILGLFVAGSTQSGNKFCSCNISVVPLPLQYRSNVTTCSRDTILVSWDENHVSRYENRFSRDQNRVSRDESHFSRDENIMSFPHDLRLTRYQFIRGWVTIGFGNFFVMKTLSVIVFSKKCWKASHSLLSLQFSDSGFSSESNSNIRFWWRDLYSNTMCLQMFSNDYYSNRSILIAIFIKGSN